MRIERLLAHPIITPDLHPDLADNINGPSLIRAPEWLPDRLGEYYLYFAHHQGTYIRLAVADKLTGPWRFVEGGTLQLGQTIFSHHIASPDVHVDHDRRQILMFFHGCGWDGRTQITQLAVSTNGQAFEVRQPVLSLSYWRAWHHGDWWYSLVMPGTLYRGPSLYDPFEEGPALFTPDMRHSAVRVRGDTVQIFYSNAYDCPERILLSTIDMRSDWKSWTASEPITVLKSEREYEGANQPPVASRRGSVHEPSHQLRDPCIFEEDGRTWLLYAVAGEWGIAIAEIIDE